MATTLEELMKVGKDLGLAGKELHSFISKEREQQQKQQELEEQRRIRDQEREEKAKEREERAQDRELKQQENEFAERERQRQHEERQLQIQMEVLDKQIKLEEAKKAAKDTRGNGSGHHGSFAGRVKIPAFQDGKDDFDAYIERFERYAEARGWPRDEWATDLSTLMTGKALETYYRLPREDSKDYDKVKEALLKRYQLTEEGFRNKFYKAKAEVGETAVQFMARLENYFFRWIELTHIEKTYEGLRNLVLHEQFLDACHKDLKLFLRERNLKTIKEVVETADRYLEAHGGAISDRTTSGEGKKDTSDKPKSSPRQQSKKVKCFSCGDEGHIAVNCPKSSTEKDTSYKPAPRRTDEDRTCFLCGRKGHTAPNCYRLQKSPSLQKAAMAMEHGIAGLLEKTQTEESNQEVHSKSQGDIYGNQPCSCHKGDEAACLIRVISPIVNEGTMANKGVNFPDSHKELPVSQGMVNGKEATVLRDSGCTGVVVSSAVVEESQYTGESCYCQLIDGTVRKVPMAIINIDTPYYVGCVKTMVMENLPYKLIIGNISGARPPNNPNILIIQIEGGRSIAQVQ
jgi:hypothetical protein